jgi:hypothetical protein
MSIYAVINTNTNKIENTIIADSIGIAEEVTGKLCIEIQYEPGSPGIGWSYDGTNFSAPVIEEPTE